MNEEERQRLKDELQKRVAADQRCVRLQEAAETVRTKIQDVAQLPADKILEHMPGLLEMLARVECGKQGVVDEILIQVQREMEKERESNAAG